MHDWNSSGQIDPTDQFIDYMAFREVMGCGIDDDRLLLNMMKKSKLLRGIAAIALPAAVVAAAL